MPESQGQYSSAREARARVDEVTRLVVQKLLLKPTERLKSAANEATAAQYAEVITELFGLDDDAPATDSVVSPAATTSVGSKTPAIS